tara:strand:+ start:223 stop:369 length:147 start_codon:yes stop_codon:yes gene_type:complete
LNEKPKTIVSDGSHMPKTIHPTDVLHLNPKTPSLEERKKNVLSKEEET